MIKSRILIPIAIAILSLHLAPAAAAFGTGQQLDTWTWRNPLPTGNHLNCVTYGGGLFVGVGTNGTIVTSANNGTNWSQQMAPPNVTLSGVAYSSGLTLFVAVGVDAASDNVILTSPDGTNWTANAQSGGIGSGGLNAVACGGGLIVAVGVGGINWYSTNGKSWAQGPTQVTTALNCVAYGDNEFVAVGNGGSIFTTQNGSSWTTQNSGTGADLSGIAYDGTHQFVAAGFEAILTSPDGVNWSTTLTDIGTAVTYGDGEFVVVNIDTYNPGVLISSDGINWQTDFLYQVYDTIAFGGGNFVAGGAGDEIALNTRGVTGVTQGALWINVVTSVSSGSLNAISYGTTSTIGSTPGVNLFVAGGAGNGQWPAVVTSPDGYAWTLDTDSTLSQPLLYNAFITGMTYGSLTYGSSTVYNFFVATLNTTAGYTPKTNGVIITSTDGIRWAVPDFLNTNVLNGIAYGMNASGHPMFVAVGTGGTNVWSSDLVTWKLGTVAGGGLVPQALNFNAVAYGAPNSTPTFVAVGAGNAGYAGQVIYFSVNGGVTWTPTGPSLASLSESFYGVTYGNGQFVAVGYDGSKGVIWTSIDGGNTWKQQTSSFTFIPPATAPAQFNGVTFANGLFVAVTSNGTIFVSPDGLKWTQSSVLVPGSLNAVTSGDYQYITVGSGGAILGSVLAVFPGTVTPNPFTGCVSFQVMGPPGITYGIYVSSDLKTWIWLGQNIRFNNAPVTVTDCNLGASMQKYYYLGPPGGP